MTIRCHAINPVWCHWAECTDESPWDPDSKLVVICRCLRMTNDLKDKVIETGECPYFEEDDP